MNAVIKAQVTRSNIRNMCTTKTHTIFTLTLTQSQLIDGQCNNEGGGDKLVSNIRMVRFATSDKFYTVQKINLYFNSYDIFHKNIFIIIVYESLECIDVYDF